MSSSIILSILGLIFAVSIVDSSLLQNITSVTHVLQPALFLIYQVKLSDFQKYIDPRFKVATFNGNAHIVIYFTKESAYPVSQPSLNGLISAFQGIDIYTIVKYKNILRRETLSTTLKNLPATLSCQPYAYEPYGCRQMKQESTVSLNNQTEFYHFYSEAMVLRINMVAKANITVNFHSNKTIDSNNVTTLGGFYLSRKNNQNEIQSLYQPGKNATINLLPIFKTTLNDLFYTQVVECTIQYLTSNYIRATIGPIQGLNNEQKPVACFYTPYARFNDSIAIPITA